MNELKAVYATDKDSVTSLYYPKSEVDKVLAAKDKEIAELKGDNETLKKQRDDLFTQGTQKAFDLVGEKLRHRATSRALWLARAKRAEETQFLWQVYCHCDKLYFCGPSGLATRKNPYRYISRKNDVEWDEFWGKIKNKCLKKAEEYR